VKSRRRSLGNTIVMKPPSSRRDGALLAELTREIGLPPGVQRRDGDGATGKHLSIIRTAEDRVTGSQKWPHHRKATAGTQEAHARAGGKSPFIVFDDAARRKALWTRSGSIGQVSAPGRGCSARRSPIG